METTSERQSVMPHSTQSKSILARIEAKAISSIDIMKPTLISPCETPKSFHVTNNVVTDDSLGDEDNDKSMANFCVPNNISMMSSISFLSEKDTLSDEASSCSELERDVEPAIVVSSDDNSASPRPNNMSLAQEKLLAKIESQNLELRHKETIVLSQRNELKQYNTMISKYRDSIRTKNNSIQALELQLKKRNEDKEKGNKEDAIDSDPSTENSNSHVRQDSVTVSLNESIESDSNECTIEMMKKEMECLRTIVGSLTKENNTYRMRENEHLQKISDSSSQVQSLVSKAALLRESLDESKLNSQSLSREKETYHKKVLSLEERLNESQIQIFELGQKAINVERELESKQNDLAMLERLLAKSRDVATIAFKENKTAEDYFGEKMLGSSAYNPLSDSLKKELQATRKREQELRSELCDGVDADGMKLGNDSIMDKLAESQQEAILYLTGEVEELRLQLEKECRAKEQLDESSMKKEDCIRMLKHENEMIASDLIVHEKKLETFQNNLSIKSGENACLQDEVKELCAKIGNMKDLLLQEEDKNCATSEMEVMNCKVLLEEKCDECKDLTIKLDCSVSREEYNLLNIQLTETKEILRETENELFTLHENRKVSVDGQNRIIADDESESSYPMVTIDINSNEEVTEDLNHDSPTRFDRKLSIFKKALKQSYEKKMGQYEKEASEKNSELDVLRNQLDSLAMRYDEDMRDSDVRKICFEAETHYEQEQLKKFLNERDQELLILKRKIFQLQQSSSGMNWHSEFKNVSETISSGVEASIELFHSLSFHEEDEKKVKEKGAGPMSGEIIEVSVPLQPSKSFSSFHTSNKDSGLVSGDEVIDTSVPLQPSRSFSSFHTSDDDDLIDGGEVEMRPARRNGKPPLASSKSFG